MCTCIWHAICTNLYFIRVLLSSFLSPPTLIWIFSMSSMKIDAVRKAIIWSELILRFFGHKEICSVAFLKLISFFALLFLIYFTSLPFIHSLTHYYFFYFLALLLSFIQTFFESFLLFFLPFSLPPLILYLRFFLLPLIIPSLFFFPLILPVILFFFNKIIVVVMEPQAT